jgi:putative endonuclease
MADNEYSVYIVRCNDDTYYTGIAADVTRRIAEHENSPRGAKYLKGRGPLTLVFSAAVGDRSVASRIEYRIKRLDRRTKEALIAGRQSLHELVGDYGDFGSAAG